MGISDRIRTTANRYLGRSGTGTGKPAGGAAGRRGTPVPSGRTGGFIRNLLNRK
jgi:hypothetical protein